MMTISISFLVGYIACRMINAFEILKTTQLVKRMEALAEHIEEMESKIE